jgi:glucose-1-phosphate adenylyltransferase
LSEGWQYGSLLKNQFLIPVPAQMRAKDESWYQGTADAIYQNINLIEQSEPHVVAIFGADHIYRMNVAQMIEYHEQKRAHVTVAAIPVGKKFSSEFGVIETAPDGRIVGFHEKKTDAPTIPGNPGLVYASMGNYIFSTGALTQELYADAHNADSSHDFGRDILPSMIGRREMFAYDFRTNRIPGDPPEAEPYWRDVGTIEAYYEANLDLRSVSPALNLYNPLWPVRTVGYPDPPAKFTFDEEDRRGQAIDSIVSSNCILSGGSVRNSVLGRGVRIHSGALVEDSIIFDNGDIGRRAKIRRAILDKNVRIPPDATIGYDLDKDRRQYYVTDSGLVVVTGERTRVEIASLDV